MSKGAQLGTIRRSVSPARRSRSAPATTRIGKAARSSMLRLVIGAAPLERWPRRGELALPLRKRHVEQLAGRARNGVPRQYEVRGTGQATADVALGTHSRLEADEDLLVLDALVLATEQDTVDDVLHTGMEGILPLDGRVACDVLAHIFDEEAGIAFAVLRDRERYGRPYRGRSADGDVLRGADHMRAR